jgi:uncharacterized protein YuzE
MLRRIAEALKRFWVDHDKEADVLYISFRRPQKATDTRMTAEGILLRSSGKELVGITILDASTRAHAPETPPLASKSPKRSRSKRGLKQAGKPPASR